MKLFARYINSAARSGLIITKINSMVDISNGFCDFSEIQSFFFFFFYSVVQNESCRTSSCEVTKLSYKPGYLFHGNFKNDPIYGVTTEYTI